MPYRKSYRSRGRKSRGRKSRGRGKRQRSYSMSRGGIRL